MKFGLLVVLAVAVLVPSLSEGRIVSRCELREKLGHAITLPPRLQKFKQQYLARGATNLTLSTNGTGAGRRKREASSEESDSAEIDLWLEELLNRRNETADEDEAEEGGERKKRSSKDRSSEDRSSEETKQSSFGLYGIFQLSDKTFCNSGYGSSKNKCNTACNAFTDDNIMDDINCFVKTDQWRLFLNSASRECQYVNNNFFDKC
ncbi:hypothetical protein PFLUV_G00002370 [Perca fluviatilis]|uniref:Glycosyl hydrolases family 22 (GH22) domain-containing protein n=1 Tax=Perca fluviatilis TaxID=8168 RepID=A0A6A5FG76_PERFL|nr:hypothetical protein PFLUV_G00002370 [Perca fluviatilis]